MQTQIGSESPFHTSSKLCIILPHYCDFTYILPSNNREALGEWGLHALVLNYHNNKKLKRSWVSNCDTTDITVFFQSVLCIARIAVLIAAIGWVIEYQSRYYKFFFKLSNIQSERAHSTQPLVRPQSMSYSAF